MEKWKYTSMHSQTRQYAKFLVSLTLRLLYPQYETHSRFGLSGKRRLSSESNHSPLSFRPNPSRRCTLSSPGQYMCCATLVSCFHFLSNCFLCDPSLSLPAFCSLFCREGTTDKSAQGFNFTLFPDSLTCMYFPVASNNTFSTKWVR